MRVIAPDGAQVGIRRREEALWLAEELGLDLVEVAPTADPPVCRLMDYGKYKYEQSVRDREARKKQSRVSVKEVRVRPNIAPHDLAMRSRKIIQFLSNGDRVKVTLRFRGREQERPQFGMDILAQLQDMVHEYGMVDQAPTLEDRNLTMVLAPFPRTKTEEGSASKKPEVETPKNSSNRAEEGSAESTEPASESESPNQDPVEAEKSFRVR